MIWSHNQWGHWGYCGKCFETIEWAEHDVPCDICGYSPCADDQHVFGEEGFDKHICQVCGYISDCVDTDNDCVCDICGQEYHNWPDSWQQDASRHWITCTTCGETYEEPHFDDDKDGKCDVCEFVMNGEQPTDPSDTPTEPEKPDDPTEAPTEPEQPADSGSKDGLDDVPKTGDLSMMVIGAAVLVFGVCAVALVRKRAV